MEEDEKVFYKPGEVVTLRQDIPNKPTMIVVRKESSMFRNQDGRSDNSLKGIRCRWFSREGVIQEAVFNTKDLIKIN